MQSKPSRREILLAATAGALSLRANPLGLPIGLQLWTVRQELKTDFDGTLQKIARIGYREVELFELPPQSKLYQKSRFRAAGLDCVSGHFYLNQFSSQQTIDAAQELGLKYMIVVFPTLRSMAGQDIANANFQDLSRQYEKITLDDYKWNAEQLNKTGEKLKKNGLQLGYHNHAVDLKTFGNVIALDELIKRTDPSLVTFEMDCGHVIHAGYKPVTYLKKYPSRFQLLHLKDLKPGFEISNSLDTELKGTDTEIGGGNINWPQLFEAAAKTKVRHYFVEHEGKMDHPPLEAIKRSYDYLHSLLA
jgi:sugar phosphate isomerase/epimerase